MIDLIVKMLKKYVKMCLIIYVILNHTPEHIRPLIAQLAIQMLVVDHLESYVAL